MKAIEVFTNESQEMLIKIDDLLVELSAAEAAELAARMSEAYSDFKIRNEAPRTPGEPLDRVRPSAENPKRFI